MRPVWQMVDSYACNKTHRRNTGTLRTFVLDGHGMYIISELRECNLTCEPTLFMKLDLPTLGYPHTSSVRVAGSMPGSRPMCCRTSSRYLSDGPCRFMMVHIRPCG